jgi:hypothetical protein
MKQRDLNASRRRKPHKGWYRLRRPQNGPETTLQYTAQEIHEMAHHQRRAGIIRPDTGDLDVSAAFVERGGGQQTKSPPRYPGNHHPCIGFYRDYHLLCCSYASKDLVTIQSALFLSV